jgi:gliding motility-associated-like protein
MGLSPNEDGLNDDFDLTAFGSIPQVTIYNRYGMIVYDRLAYTNQWHGQDKAGHLLPGGTYYYYLMTEAGEGKTGWVYLIRN